MRTKKDTTKEVRSANQKTLQVLETKLFGKVKLPKGETVLSLLGRE